MKYHRDFDWEKQCRDTLGELGFFSDDDINFFPVSSDINHKVDLYLIIETITEVIPILSIQALS